MKRGVLYSSVIGLSVVFASLIFFNPKGEKEYYQPREEDMAAEGHRGAAEWLHARRANQITGEVNPADVRAARAQLANMVTKSKKSVLGLTWDEVGPDNIGGRTRGFLISNQDPNVFYAGGVSGGLFRSTNAGASWKPVNDFLENLAVTCIAQASNGDIYFGTGEDMYAGANGDGGSGFIGQGVFKSTDGGNSFTQITSTAGWNAVGKIEVDPTNPQKIYAATGSGMQVSGDGGSSWSKIPGILAANAPTLDMVVTPSGQLWFKAGSQVYKSDDGGSSATEVTGGDLPRNPGRMRIAVSPTDENYVYAVAVESATQRFKAAYQSKDNGDTWTVIGERNAFLDPHGSSVQGQGTYDNAVTVDPKNPERIIVGGVTLWEWSATGGWQQIAGNFAPVQTRLWVHSDVHNVIFRPAPNENTIYVCSDGGISRSTDNGLTWLPVVKSYNTIQFYNIGVGGDGSVVGGTQDNSNILINPNDPFQPRAGKSLNSGDGGYADISKLNANIIFLESQYGNARRSADGGESFDPFFDLDRMAPNTNIQPGANGGGFASFVAPFELYENVFDFKSEDSIIFRADSVISNLGLGSGKTLFEGQFIRPQKSTDFIIDGVRVKAGSQVATTDASGNFVGPTVVSGNFNPATGEYDVTFSNPVSFEVTAKAAVNYAPGDTVVVTSKTNFIPLTRVLANGLASNQAVAFQDPVQSAFFMGLTGHSASPPTIPNEYGGIWMTRNAISDVAVTPTWYHIGNVSSGERPECMAVSSDGDVLYVGTSFGRVYRYSNLSNARDSASADIDDLYKAGTIFRANTSVVTRTLMSGTLPSGRSVTSIAIDPRDKNRVIITYGNYGNTNYVYYSSNATAGIPQWQSKQGNLPTFPVYSAVFNAMGKDGEVVIGTEEGAFATDDIGAAGVQWTEEITGFARVPVFSLVQQLAVRRDLQLFGNQEGAIYAGTHGRGIFRTQSTQGIGLPEHNQGEESADRAILNLYPNPAASKVFVPLNLTNRSDVMISVRDINGKLVRTMKLDKVAQSVENVELNVGSLPAGTYIVTLTKGAEVVTGKLVKQ